MRLSEIAAGYEPVTDAELQGSWVRTTCERYPAADRGSRQSSASYAKAGSWRCRGVSVVGLKSGSTICGALPRRVMRAARQPASAARRALRQADSTRRSAAAALQRCLEVRFAETAGFTHVGTFRHAEGVKLGAWHDIGSSWQVMLQRGACSGGCESRWSGRLAGSEGRCSQTISSSASRR